MIESNNGREEVKWKGIHGVGVWEMKEEERDERKKEEKKKLSVSKPSISFNAIITPSSSSSDKPPMVTMHALELPLSCTREINDD